MNDHHDNPHFFTGSERNPDNMGNIQPYGDETLRPPDGEMLKVLTPQLRQQIREMINQAIREILEEL